MSLKFTKANLVLLIMVVYQRRSDGMVLDDLLTELKTAHPSSRNRYEQIPPVRATWFSYFKDIEAAYPNGIDLDEIAVEAEKFTGAYPALATKFFRKFSKRTFEAFHSFLIDRDFLGQRSLAQTLGSLPGSLYFSLIDFLDAQSNMDEDHTSLPGVY
ncbi:hypothetical protein [Pontivivens ytuae]|uniref:Uncharacterized protein n=1 Tax=Pontivivens ytuae TaxID=2789856 RepID=A0A7S9LT56_9RHOB|nr:hypothetical protein [Pontivivens ytuae]QPH54671.1 hypothetical protein I0K15_02495 [Pontivivens ytuae]